MPLYGLTTAASQERTKEVASVSDFNHLLSRFNRTNAILERDDLRPETRTELQGIADNYIKRLEAAATSLESQPEAQPQGTFGKLLGLGMRSLDIATYPIQFAGNTIGRTGYNAYVGINKAVGTDEGDKLTYVSPLTFDLDSFGFGKLVQRQQEELGLGDGNQTIWEVPGIGLDITRNRIAGFIGELVSDPTTFMGGTSLKALKAGGDAAEAARLGSTLAHRLNRGGQIDALIRFDPTLGAKAMARRGLGDIDTATLRQAGLDRRLDIGIGRTRRTALPGTAPLVQGGQKFTGAVSRFTRDNKLAAAIIGDRNTGKLYDAARRVLAGDLDPNVGAIELQRLAEEFTEIRSAAFLNSDLRTAVAIEGAGLSNVFRESVIRSAGGKGAGAALMRQFKEAGGEIIDFMENPRRVVTALKGLPDGAPIMLNTSAGQIDVRPFFEFFGSTYDKLASLHSKPLVGAKGRELGLTGEYADFVVGYFPRAAEDINDYVAKMNLGSGAMERALRDRDFAPGQTVFGNRAFEDEGLKAGLAATNSVSRAQVRQFMREAGLSDNLPWSDNVLDQIDSYIGGIASYAATNKVAQRVVDLGLGMRLSEHGPFLLPPDKPFQAIAEGLGRVKAFTRGDAATVQAIMEFSTHEINSIINYPNHFRTYVRMARDYYRDIDKNDVLLGLYDEAEANLDLMARAKDDSFKKFFAVKAQEASLRAFVARRAPGAQPFDGTVAKAAEKLIQDDQAFRNLTVALNKGDEFLKELTALLTENTDLTTRGLNDKVLITNSIADALRGTASVEFPSWMDNIVEFQNFWRRAATTNPAFNVRNHFGGTVNELAFGHTFAETRRHQDIISRWLDDNSYVPSDPQEANILREIVDRGDFQVEYRTRFGEAAGQTTSQVIGASKRRIRETREAAATKFDAFGANVNAATQGRNPLRQNQQVEAILRGGHLMSRMKRGFNYDDARTSMFQAHFDYSDLSKVDQYARLLMPFWTFRSRNLPMQVHLLVNKPGLYGDIARFQRATENDTTLVPSYYDESFFIQTSFGRIQAIPDIPFNDLIQVTSELRRGVGESGPVFGPADAGFSLLVNDSSPVIKALIGFTTSTDVFTGAPLDNPNYELEIPSIPFLKADDKYANWMASVLMSNGLIKGKTGEDGGVYIDQRIAYALNQLMPMYRRGATLSSTEQEKDRVFARWFNFVFGGVRVYGNREARNAAYEFQEKYQTIVDELEIMGG